MTANPYRPMKNICPECGKPKDFNSPCPYCGYNRMEDGINGLPTLF